MRVPCIVSVNKLSEKKEKKYRENTSVRIGKSEAERQDTNQGPI